MSVDWWHHSSTANCVKYRNQLNLATAKARAKQQANKILCFLVGQIRERKQYSFFLLNQCFPVFTNKWETAEMSSLRVNLCMCKRVLIPLRPAFPFSLLIFLAGTPGWRIILVRALSNRLGQFTTKTKNLDQLTGEVRVKFYKGTVRLNDNRVSYEPFFSLFTWWNIS